MEHEKVVKELENRIRDARNIDDYDVSFELENFLMWYREEIMELSPTIDQ